VNAAEFGFSQRRIRVFIVATRLDLIKKPAKHISEYFTDGVLPKVFQSKTYEDEILFEIEEDPELISKTFNTSGKTSPFRSAGVYLDGTVRSAKSVPITSKKAMGKLRDALVSPKEVPAQYWIDDDKLPDWEFLKGAKSLERVTASGHVYNYSEGKMAFPDSLDKPSRTILTGEGGSSPSRFKHVIKVGKKHRRLLPIELERLNGFPDNWTKFDSEGKEISDARRAFFMGNALVVGLIEMVGKELLARYFTK